MSCKIICTLVKGNLLANSVNSSCYHLLSFKSSCLDLENLIAIKDKRFKYEIEVTIKFNLSSFEIIFMNINFYNIILNINFYSFEIYF